MRTLSRPLSSVLLAIFVTGAAHSQDGARKPFPLVSTENCFNCHFTAEGNAAFAESRDFCDIETAAVWREQDKHSRSLALLVTGEGQKLTERMIGAKLADVLQLDLGPADPSGSGFTSVRNVDFAAPPDGAKRAEYDRAVATLKQCFACHAPIGERVVGGGNRKTIENGVSCQVCHGAGLAYETVHQKPLWRLVKASDKEREYGMLDVRNPVQRAALCTSCHVGTKSHAWSFSGEPTERFVRHEWYALGHPPLPGLEYVTFAAQQPAHWRTLQEKLYQPEGFRYYRSGANEEDARNFRDFVLRTDKVMLADSYLTANPGSYSVEPSRDMARAKDVLISGLGVLATYAGLARDLHAAGSPRPEFSVYDCTACHHELRSDFPSQLRVRRSGAPGRPPPAFWTLALARLGAAQAQVDIEPQIADLEAAFAARPLGDSTSIQAAAGDVESQAWQSAKTLAALPLDKDAAAALLRELANPRHDVDRDYHAARQHAWAIREVMKDLAGVPHGRGYPDARESIVPAPLVKLLGGVQAVRTGEEYDELRRRIDGLFDDQSAAAGQANWHMPLRLKLPAGQQQNVIANLPKWLEAIATYNPEFFRAKLEPIQQAYPRP